MKFSKDKLTKRIVETFKPKKEVNFICSDDFISQNRFLQGRNIVNDSGDILNREEYDKVKEYFDLWEEVANCVIDWANSTGAFSQKIRNINNSDINIHLSDEYGATLILSISSNSLDIAIGPKVKSVDEFIRNNRFTIVNEKGGYLFKYDYIDEMNLPKLTLQEAEIASIVHEFLHLLHRIKSNDKSSIIRSYSTNYNIIGDVPLNLEEVKTIQASLDLMPRIMKTLGYEVRPELIEWIKINKRRLNEAIPNLPKNEASSC